MSPRENVTKARLQDFFEALGREYLKPARLFLSGGEGLVWRGLRAATEDVDVTYEVAPANHDSWIRCLVALSKLDRGHARDIKDVRALLEAGILESGELQRLFDAVQPAYAVRSVKSDPARFRRGLDACLAG